MLGSRDARDRRSLSRSEVLIQLRVLPPFANKRSSDGSTHGRSTIELMSLVSPTVGRDPRVDDHPLRRVGCDMEPSAPEKETVFTTVSAREVPAPGRVRESRARVHASDARSVPSEGRRTTPRRHPRASWAPSRYEPHRPGGNRRPFRCARRSGLLRRDATDTEDLLDLGEVSVRIIRVEVR
jgi:hypothetical protein